MYIISPEQIRASRALLNWSQAELAERAGVTQATIANIEVQKHAASPTTAKLICQVLFSAGIELVNGGVKRLTGVFQFIGEDSVTQLLNDVYLVLKPAKGELLVFGGDDRQHRKGVVAEIRKIMRAGIRVRVLVEEGNNFLLGPLDQYRVLPSEYFYNTPLFVYGSRVASLTSSPQDLVQVIVGSELAESYRRLFNFVWEKSNAPSHSITEQAYP